MTTSHAETRHAEIRSRLAALAVPALARARVVAVAEPTNDPEGPAASTVELWLYGVVGGFWYGFDAESVADQLRGVDPNATVIVRLHSPGGSAFEGVAVGNLLRNHPGKVIVVVDGLAASAASALAMAGDEVVMSPGAQIMIHRPYLSWTGGTADDLREDADSLDKLTTSYAELYALRAGGTTEEWTAAMTPSTWYTGAEAVEAGLADRVGTITTTNPPPAPPSAEEEDLDDEEMAARAAWDLDVLVPPAARAAWRERSPKPPSASAVGPITSTEGSSTVAFSDEQLTQMRTDFGLPADADEAAIVAAASALAARPAPPTTTTQAAPAGTAVVDTETLAQMRADSTRLNDLLAERAAERRDAAIAEAVTDGRIPPARKGHWASLWDVDPEGTRETLAKLEKGLLPVAMRGHSDPSIADPSLDTTQLPADAVSFLGQLGLTEEALRG